MEITVVEQKKGRLVFELPGTDHTFCNALKNELWNDKSVVVSGYNIAHSQISNPVIVLETDGKDVSKVLGDAVNRLKKRNSEFTAAFGKV